VNDILALIKKNNSLISNLCEKIDELDIDPADLVDLVDECHSVLSAVDTVEHNDALACEIVAQIGLIAYCNRVLVEELEATS